MEQGCTSGRIRKGTRTEDIWPPQDPFQPPPSFLSFESGFQAQEYLAALIAADSRDVERIAALPVADDEEDEEDGEALISPDVWVFEHLRRLCLDLAHWIVALQKECSRANGCTDMRAGEWLYICAAHAAGQEPDCCAIEYMYHTVDGATALLNSSRYFPSRLNIPDSSLKHFTSIARRLFRIFAHAYFHHSKTFEDCENSTSLYGRFLALTANFDLVDADLLIIPLGREE